MIRFPFALLLSLMLITLATTAHSQPPFSLNAPTAKQVNLQQLITMSKDKNTIILDSYQLEPFFHIAPANIAQKQKNAYTQQQLDQLLHSLIPSKDSPIILFCWENFQPTRKMSARFMVNHALQKNGYHNLYELKDLWHVGDVMVDEKQLHTMEEHVRTLATAIPPQLSQQSTEQLHDTHH